MNIFDRPTPRAPLEIVSDDITAVHIVSLVVPYTDEALIHEAMQRMQQAGLRTFREAMEAVRVEHGLSPDGDLFYDIGL